MTPGTLRAVPPQPAPVRREEVGRPFPGRISLPTAPMPPEPATAPPPPEPADAAAPGRRPPGAAWARALAVGLVVAAVVVLLRTSGILEGPAAVAVAGLVALAVPTSRLLSRRILLAGGLAFGAAPLLWLWDLPVGPPGRITWLMAGATAGLAGWLVLPDRPTRQVRLRSLLPRLSAADGVTVAGAATAAAFTAQWWRVAEGAQALALLGPGWDNSAHFAMVAVTRRHGVTVAGLPDLVGEHWSYQQYPQGFHTAATAVMELLTGPDAGTPRTELVTYAHASALLMTAVATMLVAGLASTPWARRNPWPLVPAGVAVPFAITFVPGGQAFVGGFPNFVVAAGLAGCAILLASTLPRIAMPLHLAALASLLISVAQGWLLLLVVAGPGVLVAGMRRLAWRGTSAAWWWAAGVLACALAGLAFVASMLASLDPGTVLVIPGGMVAHDPRLMIAVIVLTPAAVLLVGKTHRRMAWLATGPAAGLVAAGIIGAYQMSSAGSLSYYFWKLVLGVEIVDLVLIAFVWVRVVSCWRPRWRRVHAGVAVAGLAALAIAVSAVDPPPGQSPRYGPDPVWTRSAESILRAAEEAGEQHLGSPVEAWTVLTEDGSAFHPMSAQQWLLALTGRWTAEADTRSRVLLTLAADGDTVAAARSALDAVPGARIVAPPEQAALLRAALGDDAGRVVTWG